MKPKVVYAAVTGVLVWEVPSTTLQIMWSGPGSRLYIGRPLVAGGMIMAINHPTASSTYDTRKDAESAVVAFLEAKA
jgi:hypothetical protein